MSPGNSTDNYRRETGIVLESDQILAFQGVVRDYYRAHGRDLPWRKTGDPYRILISEVMLQQTQVSRVTEKYGEFVRLFPDILSLARASLREILHAWQGLGYNRRALALKRAAQDLIVRFNGKVPPDCDSLASLPGIGNATACAICAFAFNKPTIFLETNIRTVFMYHFFTDAADRVRDSHILPLVTQTLDRENPKIWYHALMDYGAALKTKYGNLSIKSALYQRQGRFEGSNRQIRGAIIRALLRDEHISEKDLICNPRYAAEAFIKNLEQLQKEGIVVKEGDRFFIP
jgi:A/G-specific adenine glycosylase